MGGSGDPPILLLGTFFNNGIRVALNANQAIAFLM